MTEFKITPEDVGRVAVDECGDEVKIVYVDAACGYAVGKIIGGNAFVYSLSGGHSEIDRLTHWKPRTLESVRDLIQYEPDSGLLFWRERGRDWFKSDRDHAWWSTRYAGKPALNYVNPIGYKEGRVLNTSVLAHRVAWFCAHGEWPDCVDHINGDRADNRLSNLRSVDVQENAKNQALRADSTSGVTGVSWHTAGEKWRAYIRVDGKQITLGSFTDKDEAIAARLDAELEFGFHSNHGRTPESIEGKES